MSLENRKGQQPLDAGSVEAVGRMSASRQIANIWKWRIPTVAVWVRFAPMASR